MIEKCRRYTNFEVNTLFEIGANHGQDAKKLATFYDVDHRNVYLFEPHPDLVAELKRKTDFNIFATALSNTQGTQNFNITSIHAKNE